MPSAYQTDVRTLTDEELRLLSEELETECLHSYGDDEWWDDSEAEGRYYEMQREIRRRWELANPGRKSASPSALSAVMLDRMSLTIAFAREVNREFQRSMKTGNTVTVRKPWRFVASDKVN